MKKIYWRPREVSRQVLALMCVISLGGLFLVEHFRVLVLQPHHAEKLAAARLAKEAMLAIKDERLRRGVPIDPEVDPAESGLLGSTTTLVTSRAGVLAAKRTTVNPNFAAVVVAMLKRANVKAGDTVAIGYSGSFPALNACVLAAVTTLKIKPVIIASASSSEWGANLPELLWLEMEKMLHDRAIFPFRSVAASVGGVDDRGVGMSKEGRKIIVNMIQRQNLTFITPKDYAESVAKRMELYRAGAKGEPIKAYINVGGLTTSVGRVTGRKEFKPGINVRVPAGVSGMDSVMARFIQEDKASVVNLLGLEVLAKRYGLPFDPTTMPPVGKGSIYLRESYNPYLAAGVLTLVLVALWAFVRTELGFRLLQSFRSQKKEEHPEPMV